MCPLWPARRNLYLVIIPDLPFSPKTFSWSGRTISLRVIRRPNYICGNP